MSATVRSNRPPTPAETFLKALRAQTAPAHERLEAHPVSQSITAPGVTTAAYRRYLQLMQQVVTGLEAVLIPVLRPLVADIDERAKQQWLAADLGPEGGETNPYPSFRFSVSNRDPAYALGAYYVLEGSTLGGRVILKSLPAAFAGRTRYFEGYGTETGRMWQSFLTGLGAAAVTPEARAAIISGATDAFAAITQYFNTCLAHEDPGHR